MAKASEKKPVRAAAKKPVKKKEPKEVKKKAAAPKPEPHVEAKVPEAVVAKPAVEAAPAEQPQAAHAAPIHVVEHKPKAKPHKIDEVFYAATGRRKTAIARVKLVPGKGDILVNERPLDDYVAHRDTLNIIVKRPLIMTDNMTKFDVHAKVHGGGVSSQAGAISLGISRALLEVNPELRKKIKAEGLLTRDPRMKERKKYGRKKARKRFQYSKR